MNSPSDATDMTTAKSVSDDAPGRTVPRRSPNWLARIFRPGAIFVVLTLVAVPLFLAAQWPSSGSVAITRGVWEDVRLGDLPVTVITRGNLESQDDVPVYCGVEDVQRDGINGTPILWIIANGSSVKKGDLLVELESTPMREALDEQTLETEEARSMLIQAKANYDNQIVQNETT
ncbi:MAG: hypothetical protein AAFP90_24075, partial [Planctomycetota bacterium]